MRHPVFRSLHAVAALATLAAWPLGAHHSFASVFDEKATVHVVGTITKVEWANPHAWFYVDVKDAAGKTGDERKAFMKDCLSKKA